MTSNLSAFPFIQERSEATPGLWNYPLSVLSANVAAIDSNVTFTFPSTETLSIFSSIDASQNLHAGNRIGIGAIPSADSNEVMTIGADSSVSNYILFHDPSGSRSNYILGSRVGGTADGLNLYDQSGATMLVSFSKQSIRFFQNVVGPVFDVGGALADTLNVATFGTGADSIESRIQAAISQASTDGVSRVYVPANMYPYSAGSVSFDTRVQMVREGGNWAVYDVQAYGASGNGTTNDSVALQSALTFAPTGAVVYIPSAVSRYRCSNLTVFRRLTIEGDGKSSELFNNLGGPTMLIKRHPSDAALWNSELQLDGVGVRGLYFSGDRSVLAKGLELQRIDHSIFQDLQFEAIQGPALHLSNTVRESIFNNITTRWCGSSASTAAVMLDDAAVPGVQTGEGHNALTFYGLRIVFSHGPALLIETTASLFSNAENKTRLINIFGWQFHGPVRAGADWNGTIPFPDSALTHHVVVLGSCHDIRFIGGNITASGQSGAHFHIRGGTGVGSGATGITITNALASGHDAPSTGTVTNANSSISVAPGCDVYLDNTWISATSAIVVPSGASIRLGMNVAVAGASSISSSAFAPTHFLTGSFAPLTGNVLYLDNVNRISVQTIAAISSNVLTIDGDGNDNNIAPLIIRTLNGSGALGNRMRFSSGVAPEIVSLASHQFTFPATHASGTATNPSIAFSSESSLGFYRSTTSSIGVSYGTFIPPSTVSFLAGAIQKWPNGNVFARTGVAASDVYMDVGTLHVRDGVGAGLGLGVEVNNGSITSPTIHFVSDLSVGFYRSGVSTIAISTGTFNLATNSVRLSMRTVASFNSTTMSVNEVVFAVGGASGVSLGIRSGGTIYYFESSTSTKG